MIAGGIGDGAALFFLGRHVPQAIVGAADLERSGSLGVFSLDQQSATKLGVDVRVFQQRRARHHADERLCGFFDGVNGDRPGVQVWQGMSQSPGFPGTVVVFLYYRLQAICCHRTNRVKTGCGYR